MYNLIMPTNFPAGNKPEILKITAEKAPHFRLMVSPKACLTCGEDLTACLP